MSIKAIETEYKGYKFRSRLEARWAVFFDAMDWAWEYEPEGYKMEYMGEIIHYLPDFWLPDMKAFVEVKGGALNAEDRRKVEALAFTSDYGVFVLGSIPDNATDWWDVCTKDLSDEEDELRAGWGSFDAGYERRELYLDALKAARQARFEHGEKG